MLLDPRHLVTLETVIRLGSFAAAAQDLGYTQSAVSQQIAELERRVGVRVVERRPVRATAAGQVLLDAEASIQATMSATAAELAALDSGLTGTVRLGAFVSAATSMVPPALAALRVSNPGVRVVLRQLETADSYAALLRGDLDLAITFDYDGEPQPPPTGIRRTLIRTDPVVVALPATHPLVDRDTVALNELGRDLLIITQVAAPHGHGLLEFQGDDFRTALCLVAEGLGAALLPELALRDAPAGVVGRRLRDSRWMRYIYVSRIDTRRTAAPIAQLESHLTTAFG